MCGSKPLLLSLAACGALCGGIGAQVIIPSRGAQEEYEWNKALREKAQRDEFERQLQQHTFPYSALPKDAPLPFHMGYREGLRQLFPNYEGLPTYPDNVPGYGGYPGAAGTPTESDPAYRMPGVKARTDDDRWPSWIEDGKGGGVMRATADRGIVVRATDRVWFKDPEEEAFIPLVFYDRFRYLETGARIEVRGKGEFQMVLDGGANVRSSGPCGLLVTAMNEQEMALSVNAATNLWLRARVRPFRVLMPDGTELTFADTLVRIEHVGDWIRIGNLGKHPIEFSGTAGQGKLEGPTFIHLWDNAPSSRPHGHELEFQGDVALQHSGDVTTVRGGKDGSVTWSGAKFRVATGSTLTLKPLAGPSSPRR